MLTQCPVCDYALEGLPDIHVCPECGYAYDKRSEVIVQGRGIAFAVATLLAATCVLLYAELFSTGPMATWWMPFIMLPSWIGWGWHLLTRRLNRVVLTRRGIELIDRNRSVRAFEWADIAEVKWNNWSGGVHLRRPDGSTLAAIKPEFLAAHRLDQQLVRDAERWRREHANASSQAKELAE